MSITRQDVEHLARLAHLDLEESEILGLTRDLAGILAYARRLEEAPATAGLPGGERGEATPRRPDEAGPLLPPGTATAQAAERAGDLFKVPPAIGGS